jgi:hypothetical protein
LNADAADELYSEPGMRGVGLTIGGRANINAARLSAGIVVHAGSIAASAQSQ